MSWIPDEWPQVSLATRLEVDCSRGRTRSRAMAMKNISLGIDDHLAGDLSKCWGSSVGRRKEENEENSNLRSGAKVDSNVYYTHTSHYLSPALDECNLLSINEAVQEEEKKQFSSLLAALKFPSNWTTQLDLRHGMSFGFFFRWSGWSMWVVEGAMERDRRQCARRWMAKKMKMMKCSAVIGDIFYDQKRRGGRAAMSLAEEREKRLKKSEKH